MIAGMISNVTPKEPMQKDIILACFPNFKLLILGHFNNLDEYEILCHNGNFNNSFSCRIHLIVWIIMNQFQN